MKTLSLTQPWATLVAIGAKKWETRSWSTKYRGPLLIHAAKGHTKMDLRLAGQWPFRKYLADRTEWTFGAIIAQVELVDCITVAHWIKANTRSHGSVSELIEEGIGEGSRYLCQGVREEYVFGNYGPGRYAWKLENVKELETPIIARGSLGIWEFDESALGHLAERSR